MNNFVKKYLLQIFIIAFLVIVGIYQIPKQEKEKELLRKEGVYVVGQLVNVKGAKGGQVVTFTFLYKGKEWKGKDYKVIGKKYIGAKFIVKILPTALNVNEIFPEYLIKDTLIVQPEAGWPTIPKELISSYPIEEGRFP